MFPISQEYAEEIPIAAPPSLFCSNVWATSNAATRLIAYRCLWAMVLMASWAAADAITSPAVLPRASPTGSALTNYLHDCDGKHILPHVQRELRAFPMIPRVRGNVNQIQVVAGADSALPACIKVTNVVAKQHIWYCSTTESTYTSSYENLVTIGSMALPPSRATVTTGPKTVQTSTHSPSSTMGPASPTPTIAASSLSSETPTGLSAGVIAGIVIGVICVLAIIAIIAYLRYRLYCKRRGLIQHVIDASCGPRDGNMSQNQPLPPSPIDEGPDTPQPTYTDAGSPGYVARSIANDPEDYFSPIEVNKRANAAEALSKLENRDRGLFEMGTDGEHSVDRTIGRAEVGSGSGDTTGGGWKTVAAQSGSPSAQRRNTAMASELGCSSTREGEGGLNIQRASPPSGQPWGASYPADEELAQHNQRAFSTNSISTNVTDANGISPALTNTTFDPSSVVSPLLSSGSFSMTPLMGLNPKPSVGELNPSATVQGPLNWPILTANRNSSKLTSATGWESKYLSPEMAMSNGFPAGEVAEDANTAMEKRDSNPSDADFIMPSRVSR
ncbi:hypothetical protein V493_03737 [Pseudogymnoascus sp. VKM F-4281 (FW-2241)]|nr:hypothetical protein V493_03737 [Pseudogymnoascus sp. VKM F-4281 (FW-2241)]